MTLASASFNDFDEFDDDGLGLDDDDEFDAQFGSVGLADSTSNLPRGASCVRLLVALLCCVC